MYRAFTAVRAHEVKELRSTTGAPITKCREALAACSGDSTQAREWLRREGLVTAEKAAAKAASQAAAGERRVAVRLVPGGSAAVGVVLTCDTDFTANSEIFRSLYEGIATRLAQEPGSTLAEAGDKGGLRFEAPVHPQIRSLVASEAAAEVGALVRERVVVDTAVVVEAEAGGAVGVYVHDDKRGAIVALGGVADAEVARLVARQVVGVEAESLKDLLAGELLGGAGETVAEVLGQGRVVKIVKLGF